MPQKGLYVWNGSSLVLSGAANTVAPPSGPDLSTKSGVITNAGLLSGWTEEQLDPVGTGIFNTTDYNGTQTIENKYIKDVVSHSNSGVLTLRNCVIEPDLIYYGGDAGCVNNTAGGTVIIENCIIRQKDSKAWCWLNAVHGRNYTIRYSDVYFQTDGFGIVSPADGNCNVVIEYNYVHDFCYVYWPEIARTQGVSGGTAYGDYRGKKESHSDDHTHNDGIQQQAGLNSVIRFNVIEAYANPAIGTIPLATGGTLPGGFSKPDSMAASLFAMPYGSLQSGSDKANQVTGQCILLQANVGTRVSGLVQGNWVDGGAVLINFNTGGGGTAGFDFGTSRDNHYGRNSRVVGGVRATARRSPAVTGTFINETYEDNGSAISVQVQ